MLKSSHGGQTLAGEGIKKKNLLKLREIFPLFLVQQAESEV